MAQRVLPSSQKQTVILRSIKLTSWSKAGASAGHTWRTTEVPHADKTRTHLNEDWRPASSPAQLRAATEERIALADNFRINSVLLIEYIVSANHHAFIENGGNLKWKEYFKDALEFFEGKHGDKNIVGVNVQLDEHTPHLVIYAVPLVNHLAYKRQRNVITGKENGKIIRGYRTYAVPARTSLSASHFIGSRQKLRTLQTEFAEHVGTKHGLQRGLRHSAATHVTTKTFHQALIKGLSENIDISLKDLNKKGFLISKESNEEYVERITTLINEHYQPAVAKASFYEIEKRRANEMAETARRAEENLKHETASHHKTKQQLAEITEGLSSSEISEIKRVAEKFRYDRAEQEREARLAKKRAEQREAAREQQLENEFVEKIMRLDAQQLAAMPVLERKKIWELAVERADLEPTLFSWIDSGIFDHNGAVIENLRNTKKYSKNKNLYDHSATITPLFKAPEI
jgi:hypothetical protein|tara:strand:- start:421 stop:1797 length:1377 start_codon:yes stop_codon:yes gene_type:complete